MDNMKRWILICLLPLCWLPYLTGQAVLWRTTDGAIAFTSDAPLELIEARSPQMQGVIKPADGGFAFSVEMRTFQGFNSALQREHFNENYMESHKYPKATFTGRIIEQVDLTQDGTYTVRAKGILTVHGVEHERIIKSTVVVKGTTLQLTSAFTVPLAEHRISIPHVVYQKIAEEIQVSVEARFQRTTPKP